MGKWFTVVIPERSRQYTKNNNFASQHLTCLLRPEHCSNLQLDLPYLDNHSWENTAQAQMFSTFSKYNNENSLESAFAFFPRVMGNNDCFPKIITENFAFWHEVNTHLRATDQPCASTKPTVRGGYPC